jgi:hypothetical protein
MAKSRMQARADSVGKCPRKHVVMKKPKPHPLSQGKKLSHDIEWLKTFVPAEIPKDKKASPAEKEEEEEKKPLTQEDSSSEEEYGKTSDPESMEEEADPVASFEESKKVRDAKNAKKKETMDKILTLTEGKKPIFLKKEFLTKLRRLYVLHSRMETYDDNEYYDDEGSILTQDIIQQLWRMTDLWSDDCPICETEECPGKAEATLSCRKCAETFCEECFPQHKCETSDEDDSKKGSAKSKSSDSDHSCETKPLRGAPDDDDDDDVDSDREYV